MKIYLTDKSLSKVKYFGDTSEVTPIPRVGEMVFTGYSPMPKVHSVSYVLSDEDGKKEYQVYVTMGGFLIQ